MRALYDSEAHAMYIDVVDPPHCDDNWVIDSAADQLFLHVDGRDRIVGIEVLDADDVDTALLRRFVGTRGLDADQVIAAHAAALRAQDQAVTLVFDRLHAAQPVAIDRIAWFSDLVAENPDEPRARYGLAVALRQAERWDDAVPQYRAYLDLATDEGAAYGHLAECLAALGDDDGAADAYLAGIDAALAHGHTGLADDFREAMEALG